MTVSVSAVRNWCAVAVSAAVLTFGASGVRAATFACEGTTCYSTLGEFNTATGSTLAISVSHDEFLGVSPSPPPAASAAATTTFINTWATFDVSGLQTIETPAGGTSGTVSAPGDTLYGVWLLKFGNNLAVFLLDTPVNSLNFAGLSNALSHFGFGNGTPSEIPLPPALILFGTALVGMGILGRRRAKQKAMA